MHTMRGHRSGIAVHISTCTTTLYIISTYGVKSTNNTTQYFNSLSQHKLLTQNAVVHQLKNRQNY